MSAVVKQVIEQLRESEPTEQEELLVVLDSGAHELRNEIIGLIRLAFSIA